jgi:hypothetical protein
MTLSKNVPVCLKDMYRMPKLMLVFNQGKFSLFSEPFNGSITFQRYFGGIN